MSDELNTARESVLQQFDRAVRLGADEDAAGAPSRSGGEAAASAASGPAP